MKNEINRPARLSRRNILYTVTGVATVVGTAGCLTSQNETGSTTQIKPEEPSDPREGTPEEFYYFLEENGITVKSLFKENNELYLTYRSDATNEEESDREIRIIYEVYAQGLIHRGSDVKTLYCDLEGTFEDQAIAWGIDSEWVLRFDPPSSKEDQNTTSKNETPTNTSAGDASTDTKITGDDIALWSNIMNTKTYEEDIEDSNTGNGD